MTEMKRVVLEPPITGFPEETQNLMIHVSKKDFLKYMDHSMDYSIQDFVKNQIDYSKIHLPYKCRDGIANFKKALEHTKKDNQYNLLHQMVRAIDHNKDTFPSCDLGGYLIYHNKKTIFLENKEPPKSTNPLKYGYVDVDKMKLYLAIDANYKLLPILRCTECKDYPYVLPHGDKVIDD